MHEYEFELFFNFFSFILEISNRPITESDVEYSFHISDNKNLIKLNSSKNSKQTDRKQDSTKYNEQSNDENNMNLESSYLMNGRGVRSNITKHDEMKYDLENSVLKIQMNYFISTICFLTSLTVFKLKIF